MQAKTARLLSSAMALSVVALLAVSYQRIRAHGASDSDMAGRGGSTAPIGKIISITPWNCAPYCASCGGHDCWCTDSGLIFMTGATGPQYSFTTTIPCQMFDLYATSNGSCTGSSHGRVGACPGNPTWTNLTDP
jgi:hypothetical protein